MTTEEPKPEQPEVAAPLAAAEPEEPEDQKDHIEQQCMQTPTCAPVKVRLDTCTERVTANPDSGEDCVEEFFDLMHCVHGCAPEKIFHDLK